MAADSVLRAMTDDGGFRVIAARTTDTVRDAAEAQKVVGRAARLFAELLTGTVLFRETMAPTLRVQAILKGAGGRGQMVADSSPEGLTRGLVRMPDGELEVGVGAQLQMMRTLPNGSLHRGVVEVPPGGGISGGLMTYMQTSEQVVSMISVGCQMDGDRIVAAGGYIVQLLPELSEEMLAIMTERLEDFRTIDELFETVAETPGRLVDEILYGMEFTRLEESSVSFTCQCSRVRVMTSLATLPRADIEELMKDGKPIELSCDYCGAQYSVPAEQLRGLLESA